MHILDLLQTRLLLLFVLPPLQPLPYHSNKLAVSGIKQERLRIEEYHSREFEFINKHSKTLELVQCPECLVLAEYDCRVDCVVVL